MLDDRLGQSNRGDVRQGAESEGMPGFAVKRYRLVLPGEE